LEAVLILGFLWGMVFQAALRGIAGFQASLGL